MTDWRHILYLFLLLSIAVVSITIYMFSFDCTIYINPLKMERHIFSFRICRLSIQKAIRWNYHGECRKDEWTLLGELSMGLNKWTAWKGKSSDNSRNAVVGYSVNEESDVLLFCFFPPSRGETLARVDVGHISWIADEAKNEPVADRLRLASQSKGRFARE